MIDRLERLYKDVVSRIVLVVHPSFEAALRHHVSSWGTPAECVVQRQPTGMLDAIMLATNPVRAAAGDGVWITWCDQGRRSPRPCGPWCRCRRRIRKAARRSRPFDGENLYIHLERETNGESSSAPSTAEEGTPCPRRRGERYGAVRLSPTASTWTFSSAIRTGCSRLVHLDERAQLPAVHFVGGPSAHVVTFPSVDEEEAIGVNTPEELTIVERYLAARDGSPA